MSCAQDCCSATCGIRYSRIHNLESVQGPLHRLLRVVDLRIETAGAAEQEARLRVLSAIAADEVRRRVLEGKRRTASVPEPDDGLADDPLPAVAAPVARELVRVGLWDLVVLGLTQNRGGIVLGAALGALWEADLFDDGFGRPTDVLQAHLSRLWEDGRLLVDPEPALLALLAAGVVCVLVAIRLLSVGGRSQPTVSR